MTTTRVAVGENLTLSPDGELQLAPWSVPFVVHDVMVHSTGDGDIIQTIYQPGKLLMDQQLSWRNDTPVDVTMLVRVTRRYKRWITSNPNAVQFRDRYTWGIDADPVDPVTGSISNSQAGSAGDIGTNTVAEPVPGKFWHWWGTSSMDEWIWLPVKVGEIFALWYKCFAWTPPPFADNANKSQPQHVVEAGWSRIQLKAYPQQGKLVFG